MLLASKPLPSAPLHHLPPQCLFKLNKPPPPATHLLPPLNHLAAPLHHPPMAGVPDADRERRTIAHSVSSGYFAKDINLVWGGPWGDILTNITAISGL